MTLSNSMYWFVALLICLDRTYLLRLLLIGEVLLKVACAPLNLKLRYDSPVDFNNRKYLPYSFMISHTVKKVKGCC